jgi:UDP-glucuronate 4-epimerase
MKKILITGCAGFIGYHLTKQLLKKNIKVIGIDNLNNYYSVKIKLARKKKLILFKNFNFIKADLENFNKLSKIFQKYKFDLIINLAAQAGVAYSMKFPEKYFKSNISGFFNICNLAKKYRVNKVIYASSSSVYGDNKNLPVKENYRTNPLNYYAISKVNNEETANFFSQITKTKFIGLRFFSIYGPFGRPDMLIYKMLNLKNKLFYLNNFGNHSRDFTYIDDAINMIEKLLFANLKKNNEIFNICNSRKVKINSIVNSLRKYGIPLKVKKRGFQKGDIKNSFGCNKKIKKLFNIKNFTPFNSGLIKTLDWYYNNKIIYN